MEAKIENKFVLELNSNEEIIQFSSALKKLIKKESKIGFGKVLNKKEFIVMSQLNSIMSNVNIVDNTDEGLYT